MQEELSIKGKIYKVRQLRGFGAYASAKLNGNIIEIKIPVYLNKEKSFQTFQSLRNRIIKSIERAGNYTPKPEFLEFYNGQEIPIMAKSFTINITEGEGSASRAKLKENLITVRLAKGLSEREKKRHTYTLSRRIISKNVLPDLVSRTNELNERYFRFRFDEVRIKEQETRWGSYSKRTNRINLNFRLLFAPQEIIDSVIVHELAHIKVQDHSKRFWDLVLSAIPDYKAKRKWLRKNGNSLGVFPTQAIAAPIRAAPDVTAPNLCEMH
jgi:predicted metal-dependent hydrolase